MHFGQVAAALGEWFETPPRPQAKGLPLIEYRLPGTVAYYMAEGPAIVHLFALPEKLEPLSAELRGHLGPEAWSTWEHLIFEVNSHIDAVVDLWNSTEKSVAESGRDAGLVAMAKPGVPQSLGEAPVDYFQPAYFVNFIWREPEYFAKNGVHSWEAIRIGSETVSVYMRHTLDIVPTFVFEGSNMVRSQSRDSVERMRKALEVESATLEPKRAELTNERGRLDARISAFQVVLKTLEAEYLKTHQLPGSCPSCPT